MKKTLIYVIIVCITIHTEAQTWNTDFVGFDSLWSSTGGHGQVFDMHNYKDSILFIGGAFQNANNEMNVKCIISWDGNTISRYENGVEVGPVDVVFYYKNKLLIGDYFPNASGHPNTANLAIWNDSIWEGPSIGPANSFVEEFTVFEGNLIVGGNFSALGSTPFGRIVAYDGVNWYDIGFFGMWIRALAVFNGELYAGGYSGIRKYLGGTSWEYLEVQPNDFIFEFQVDTFNTFLYMGGQFTYIGNEVSHAVAMWDGFKWKAMGDYCMATILPQASLIYKGDLYVGGGYNEDAQLFYITRWNGEQWDSIGGNFSSAIAAMEIFRDTIYIGGAFSTFNGNRSKGLVKLAMPDNGCEYIKPRINTLADTFYLSAGQAQVQFYNNNPYVNSWSWNFGDSGTDNIKDPLHIYTIVGDYTVTVTVSHDTCTKSAQKTITILNGIGFEELTKENLGFNLYPNPTTGDFTIECTLPNNKSGIVKAYRPTGSELGQKALEPGFNKLTMPASLWKVNVILVAVYVEGKQVFVEKVIKE